MQVSARPPAPCLAPRAQTTTRCRPLCPVAIEFNDAPPAPARGARCTLSPRSRLIGSPLPPVCTPAIHILQDMGVLKELVDNNEAHFADNGGFVSPNGTSYIGNSKEKLGEAACCAVKRINLDMRVARCAARSGAKLKEGFEVTDASFDKSAGLWTVTSAKGEKVRRADGGRRGKGERGRAGGGGELKTKGLSG